MRQLLITLAFLVVGCMAPECRGDLTAQCGPGHMEPEEDGDGSLWLWVAVCDDWQAQCNGPTGGESLGGLGACHTGEPTCVAPIGVTPGSPRCIRIPCDGELHSDDDGHRH